MVKLMPTMKVAISVNSILFTVLLVCTVLNIILPTTYYTAAVLVGAAVTCAAVVTPAVKGE